MIGRLRGDLTRKKWPLLLVDVAGVGYEVQVPLGTFERLPAEGAEVTLEVLTSFKNETLQLFGFGSGEEKELFARLLSVSGVGPRLALAVLSNVSVAELIDAVQRERLHVLEAVPGIGKKTARRLLLELKDKLAGLEGLEAVAGTASPSREAHGMDADAIGALESLGYPRATAEKAVREARASGSFSERAELIRAALRKLGA
ncbi:MAG: Holliday junction branch migration protein RuvA [Acidobacteriota bacterium]|nr:MAG: Holliday junction branch migration protein RuvA [Acidobacteriota bacterium]